MKIQKQKYEHDPENGIYGDCYRTCVAMILDMDRDTVPHFSKMAALNPDGPSASEYLRQWLKPQNLGLFSVVLSKHNTTEEVLEMLGHIENDVPFMLIGESARYKGVGHVVVVKNGKIIADPSGSGIIGPSEDYYWVELICVLNGSLLK